jgi:predicted ester cyclase
VDAFLAHHKRSFRSRSAPTLAADHAEDGTLRTPAEGTRTGRGEIQKVYEYWLTAFPDMDFDWDAVIIDGDRVAFMWHFGGTVSGQFFGDVRAGTRVQFDGAAQYTLSPEGIVSANHVYDFTGALVTAGALKVKPA